jgi:uncharacterized protein (DUF2336 family)
MQTSNVLLHELETAVSQGTPERRRAALSYATDLLIAGRYSDHDTWMFGEVLGLLASEIESAARAELAERLASVQSAPANIIRRLAFDDSIDVAGPVLRNSEQLTVDALVENAKSKSQGHLLAISQRSSLHQDITDALVARGNQEVVRSVARNPGARFSDSGFWRLVHRSENDIVLTMAVGARKDMPRHHFQKLIARASDEVKARLAAARPEAAAEIQKAVTEVTGSIQAKLGPASRTYFAAKRRIAEMRRSGELTEDAIVELSKSRKFEEVTVAFSLLCDLPVHVVERALLDERGQMILILAKAADLSWAATREVLFLCAGEGGIAEHDLDKALSDYSLLRTATARRVIAFYRARQESRKGLDTLRPLQSV